MPPVDKLISAIDIVYSEYRLQMLLENCSVRVVDCSHRLRVLAGSRDSDDPAVELERGKIILSAV